MSLVLGLLVAAFFGSGDFLGGLASRRMPTISAVGIAQLSALVGAVVVVVVAGGSPGPQDLALGGLAGLTNVIALSCLYQGLAIGQIGVVAPLTAVIAAVIPVGWALVVGERPSALALVGVALAIAAGGLISLDPSESGPDRPGSGPAGRALLLAIAAGFAFGLSFVCYAATSHESGMWPVLAARFTAVLAVVVFAAVTRPVLQVQQVPAAQAAVAGVLDITATTVLLVAVRAGLTATVAPVAALAPGFTVGHARWYLHEKTSRLQMVGVGIALVGLALIATG
jgi:drug/metabolite transporter (DMT)-like permease